MEFFLKEDYLSHDDVAALAQLVVDAVTKADKPGLVLLLQMTEPMVCDDACNETDHFTLNSACDMIERACIAHGVNIDSEFVSASDLDESTL